MDEKIRALMESYHQQEDLLRASARTEQSGSVQQARLHGQAEGLMAARLQAEHALAPRPVTDPIAPAGEEDGSELTPEMAYGELRAYERLGMLEYVLPTEPLGEAWTLGFKGQIIKLAGMDQCAAFLAGMSVAAHWAHAQIVTHDPLRDLMAEPLGEVPT